MNKLGLKMKIGRGETLRIETRLPTLEEYRLVRSQAQCEKLEDLEAEFNLEDDLYGILVFDGCHIIGIGRVAGDGVSYFYIRDLMVHPKYRNRGIGRLIMVHLESYFEHVAPPYAYIGLIAAKGTKGFYKKFGFREREKKGRGMYKFLLK